MLLRQIEYFQAIIENGNFYEAAEQFHVSQSAVSQQIQTVDKVLRETSVSRSIFLCVYEIYSENRKFSLGLHHP